MSKKKVLNEIPRLKLLKKVQKDEKYLRTTFHHQLHAHFFPLSSQGNVYTLSTLRLVNGAYKILVASLQREVICFQYQESSTGVLIPTSKEITFTYLPSGAEIISMTTFNKSETQNDFVIGITIIKNSNDLHAFETYLNIYSCWEESADFNMESISQNCVNNIELKFIPYHLTHTFLATWNEDELTSKEIVFLLSGSDNKVHVYRENKTNHTYKEIDCKDFFPEFLKPRGIVVWIDVCYYNNYSERVTVFACECGYIRLCRVCTKTTKILFNFSTQFDCTISTVRLYEVYPKVERPSFMKGEFKAGKSSEKEPEMNLIVVNTLLPSIVFENVLVYGLRKYATLPRFELINVHSCTEVSDMDFDGFPEVIIGTNNHEVILYKYDDASGWTIIDVKQFPTPIFGLKCIDVTGDGVKELIVLTLKGVHILQYNALHVNRVLEEKLKEICPNHVTCQDLGDIKS